MLQNRTLLLLAASAVFLLQAGQLVAGPMNVAVFDDGAWVDTSGGFAAESDTVQASLVSLGHTVNPFTGITAAAFTAGIGANDVLLIPELENGDLGSAISPAAASVISTFVSNGGGLIQMGGSNFGAAVEDVSFLNAVFGFSLTGTGSQVSTATSSTLNAGNAAGTAFAGGPATIPNESGTHPLTGGLPGGSLSIYEFGGDSTVTLIPFGSGQIAHLGWDWFDAAPLGSDDGGWLSVLDAAVMEVGAQAVVPEPTSMALFGLTALGMGVATRRRRRQESVDQTQAV